MARREFSIGEWRLVRPDTEGVWFCTLQPAGVNVGLVAGSDHVMLVDTGSSPEQGRALAASAAELVGRPVDTVVITHGHFDHFFGLAGVHGDAAHADEEHPIESIGHELLATGREQAISRDSDEIRADLGFEASELALPTTQISMARALDLGGRRVEIVHFGPAHTQGDLVVFLPQDDMVFTGDLIEQSGEPAIGEDSTLGTWPSVLDGILGTATERTVLVPGHGTPVDRMFAFEQRANIGMLYGQSEMLVRRGVKLDQALAALDSDDPQHPGRSQWDWPYSKQTVKIAMPLAYAELAKHGLTPRTQLPMI